MSDIINQIADAIEAEIHEAWTESDADFIRGIDHANTSRNRGETLE